MGIRIGSMIGIGRHGGVRLAGGGALPFSDTFTRADGVLGAPWLGGSTWAIVSGKAVNTPTVGSELVVNGNFAAWTADNPDSWSVAGEAGANIVTEAAGACRIVTDGALVSISQAPPLVVGRYYRGGFGIGAITGTVRAINTGTGITTYTTTGSKVFSFRALDTGVGVQRHSGALDVTLDDFTCKQLTLATLFNVANFGTPNVDVSAAATIVAGTQAGVVVNLDSLSSPANFVIGYHDGTTAKLEKCVAGTYTTLVSATTAYSAGAAVRVVKDGETVQLFYGASQVGTDQTVSDAGIVSNTLHGLFSTSELNSLDTFTVTAV